MHPTHLTSTQAMFVGFGRLELYKLVVRYCSVLEVQEEITLCFVALKPPLYFEWTLCDSLAWFPSPFLLLVSWLPTGSRQEATLTQPASDPCRLWSSVPSKRKRAVLWGQKLYFSHDMVCSEESACLCS